MNVKRHSGARCVLKMTKYQTEHRDQSSLIKGNSLYEVFTNDA